jgi:uridylate kinase
LETEAIAEPYIKSGTSPEKGRIVILERKQETLILRLDYSSCFVCVEIHADVILKGTRVDGVYDSILKNADATKFDFIFDDVIKKD